MAASFSIPLLGPVLVGDWNCPNCTYLIDGKLTICWKCSTPRTAVAQAPGGKKDESLEVLRLQDFMCEKCGYNNLVTKSAWYAEFLRHNQQLCKRCKHPRLLPGQTEAAAPTGAARPAATGPAPKRQRLGEAAPAAAASPPPRPPSSPSPPPERDCDPDAAWAQERERRKKKEQEAEERRRLMRERRQKAGAAGCAPQDLEADAEKRRLIRERRRGMGLAAKEVIIADD